MSLKPGLHITPALLAQAYELLAMTAPFSRWKMPPVDRVTFNVTATRHLRGACTHYKRTQPVEWLIDVSIVCIGRLDSLIEVMAHEMTHIQAKRKGPRNQGDHGAVYQKYAAQVCRHHGFDPRLF